MLPRGSGSGMRRLLEGHELPAQLVIVKSKRLCMDYNAGLLSQGSYLRASRQIDAAFARADQIFERERNQKRR